MHVRPWRGRAATNALVYLKWRARQEDLPCCICGEPIDFDLDSMDDLGCTVEHVKPRSTHPELTWIPSNHAPAHSVCNKSRGNGS